MAIKIETKTVSLSVRDLVQMNKKSRPILSSFPLPQRGLLGRQAQSKLQQQQQKTFGLFHQEYPVKGTFNYNGYVFHISGKIDSLYSLNTRFEIEEIKSVILTTADFNNFNIDLYPEFSEQVLFYCYLLQKEQPEREIIPYLTIINLVDNKVRHFKINYAPLTVESMLFKRLQSIIEEVLAEDMYTAERIRQLSIIDFSLPETRPQQQKMMDAVAETLRHRQHHLLVSAPTGTGKTAAALYPALQFAIKQNKKIFFATAKSTQQQMVRDTLAPLCSSPSNPGLDLKVLFLRNTEKMCANTIYFCHEDFCPWARNYQDRLLESGILGRLLSLKLITPEIIFNEAKQQLLCPAEVMLDLTTFCDIIVGDYNYVFDPAVLLRRIFHHRDYSHWILILDEAHNLYQRGMDYYSPQLGRQDLTILRRLLKDKKTKIHTDLSRSLKEISSVLDRIHEEGEIHHAGQQYFELSPDRRQCQQVFDQYETGFINYLIYRVRKKIVLPADPFEQFYFKFRRFIQVLKLESPALIVFYHARDGGILKIQCCDPAEQLSRHIQGFHSVIAMSATLDPISYYREVLGFDAERTTLLTLDSPFPAENRKIVIIPGVSTRFKKRYQSYPYYAEIIEKVIGFRKGNYIAFMPSYDFLHNVNIFLGKVKSEKLIQSGIMSMAERDDMLQQLRDISRPKLLLAVMGGIFSEGVDFSGDMCIGVIVFGPGLPQVNYERELIRRYYDQKVGDGFDYAYRYPGINKVIQAVGRLIRSQRDTGIIVLADERFSDEKTGALLPDYWYQHPGDIIITDDYGLVIKEFWEKMDKKK
jgi:DNA excision repair protein ERCC-2